MAKDKKGKSKGNKKNRSLLKTLKPYLKDNRVVYSILGAAGLGVALTASIRSGHFKSLLEGANEAIRGWKTPAEEKIKRKTDKVLATA